MIDGKFPAPGQEDLLALLILLPISWQARLCLFDIGSGLIKGQGEIAQGGTDLAGQGEQFCGGLCGLTPLGKQSCPAQQEEGTLFVWEGGKLQTVGETSGYLSTGGEQDSSSVGGRKEGGEQGQIIGVIQNE